MISRCTLPRALRPDLESFWGIDKTYLSKIIINMTQLLYLGTKHLVERINMNRLRPQLRQLADAVGRKVAYHDARNCKCVGFIDGTFRKIARPVRSQQTCYSGQYRAHGLRYEVITFPNGLLEHVYGPIEGRHHDSWLLYQSRVLDEMYDHLWDGVDEEHPNRYFIYGDPAYPLHPCLLKPYCKQGITELESVHNARYAGVRIAVEWGFGVVTQLFQGLNFKPHQKILLSPVGATYVVCCILTNIHTIIAKDGYGNKITQYFGTEHLLPSIDEYLSGVSLRNVVM